MTDGPENKAGPNTMQESKKIQVIEDHNKIGESVAHSEINCHQNCV